MKPARLVVFAIALAAGGSAALLAGRIGAPAPEVTVVEAKPSIETVDVLVASTAIPIGNVLSGNDVRWRTWPKADSASFITRDARPQGIEEVSGAIVRTSFAPGEPVKEEKLVKANGSGFLSAILASGMRAISTEISPETGAGGFILPNDRVDVILTRRDAAAERRGQPGFASETVLQNVRVLAIDQAIEEKNGTKVVVGKTATLELNPEQSEQLALSRQLGTLHLALRSLVDSRPGAVPEGGTRKGGSVTVVRYGIASQVGHAR